MTPLRLFKKNYIYFSIYKEILIKLPAPEDPIMAVTSPALHIPLKLLSTVLLTISSFPVSSFFFLI